MKIYLVGGAVRDQLLGLPVKERDYVVVGATIADMLNNGYRQVGKEFPVFLHPKTNEEYALARMERKVKPGYKGFTFDASPHVTLEEDLLRRDLTINAMALSEEDELIDPYHGKADLDKKILRHVSQAFLEDPVRILRVGRFLARYAHLGFQVAPETIELMHQMVIAGEVDALVPERVWKEWERALGEENPEKFFVVLDDCGALATLFPGIAMDDAGMAALIAASQLSPNPVVRFASLLYALPAETLAERRKTIANICNRYRVPNAYRELAQLVALHVDQALAAREQSAEILLSLLSALDIFRRDERFQLFLLVCKSIARAKGVLFDEKWWLECAAVAKSVDVQELIAGGLSGVELAVELKRVRERKIVEWLVLKK